MDYNVVNNQYYIFLKQTLHERSIKMLVNYTKQFKGITGLKLRTVYHISLQLSHKRYFIVRYHKL